MPTDNDESHERKLVTILAADVAGYSRLMADDEVGTMRTLTEYREVFTEHVTGHKGRVVDTAGDSVLAIFDSVVEAVQASVDVQRELSERNETLPGHRKMHFRIGVNLGDIIIRDDGTIYGDGVNVAARLEALAEPGGIMLADFARQAVKGKLDVGLEDAGEHDVKNISEPVRAYRVLLDSKALAARQFTKTHRRPKVIAALAAGLAILVGLAVWGITIRVETPQMVMADGTPTDDPILAMPMGPTLAVMRFKNLSGDPDQRYFAEGITDDLLTRLSRFQQLRIVDGTSFQTSEGEDPDIRQLASKLGADYVLSGSVRRASDNVRLTIKLLSAEDGTHLWAQEYDRSWDAAALLATQDEITNQIAAALSSVGGILIQSEVSKAARDYPKITESYDCVLRAYRYLRLLTAEGHLEARVCLTKTVEAEPEYAEAWALLAAVYGDEYWGLNPDPDAGDAIDKMRRAAQKAIEIDSHNQRAQKWLAVSDYYRRDIEAYVESAHRALKVNPNDTHTLMDLGLFLWHSGRVEMGVSLMKKAIALAPNPPPWYYGVLSLEPYRTGDYDKALELAIRSETPGNQWTYFQIAIAYGQLGRATEARAAVEELLKVNPAFKTDLDAILDIWAIGLPGEVDHWIEGLEKAGLFDELEAPSRPVIAVLPFTNMSGDPAQEYFADGVTEDIITRLAKVSSIRVLGRNTTFQFRDQAVDVQAIAEGLGANYVLEGSVRRRGESLRVTAQLLDGKDGTHIWAETYDRRLDVADIFDIQDSITEIVAARIGDPLGEISRNEFRRVGANQPGQLSSYECLLLWNRMYVEFTYENYLALQDCSQQAIEEDPDYAWGWAIKGTLKEQEVAIWTEVPHAEGLEEALPLLETAVRLAPDEGMIRIWFARALILSGDMARGREQLEKGLSLEPNNATLLGEAADVVTFYGDFQRGVALMERMKHLNPNYSPWLNFVYAKMHVVNEDWESAIVALQDTQMTDYFWMHASVAAAKCLNGDKAAGRSAFDRALEIQPNLWDILWPAAEFWNPGPDAEPWVQFYVRGFAACGYDVPPDPRPTAKNIVQ
jgi:adenylate cyclase